MVTKNIIPKKNIFENKTYKITGMHCASCAGMVELDLEEAGINAKCSFAKETLEVPGKHDPQKLQEIINKSGYNISEK